MGVASPFFRELPLASHGLEWVTPRASAAHPLDNGDVVMLYHNAERTAEALGQDREAYWRSIGTIARDWSRLEGDLLSPIGFPTHPLHYARFGVQALLPAESYARMAFSTPRARALFAGCAAHSILPLTSPGSAAVALVLAAAGHANGWPIVRGGSQALANALEAHLRSLGGELSSGTSIERYDQLPKAGHFLFDTSPRAMARIMGDRFPSGFSQRLERFPYGPGSFKVD